MDTAEKNNKKNVDKNKDGIKPNLSADVLIVIILFAILLLVFILQPDNRQALFSSKSAVNTILILLKVFLLEWFLAFSTLVVALLTFRNILLTKESMAIARGAIMVSQNTLKQMQLSDQKNTAPMLKFDLSIGELLLLVYVKDEERPREVILWSTKADAVELAKPHYLNLNLKNIQEHPHGVAIGVSIKIKIDFQKCESKNEKDTEVFDIDFTYMDAKEEYEQSIIKISGIPSLSARVESVRYKDMFGQQYVIAYGLGSLEKTGSKTRRYFVPLSGQSPDNP